MREKYKLEYYCIVWNNVNRAEMNRKHNSSTREKSSKLFLREYNNKSNFLYVIFWQALVFYLDICDIRHFMLFCCVQEVDRFLIITFCLNYPFGTFSLQTKYLVLNFLYEFYKFWENDIILGSRKSFFNNLEWHLSPFYIFLFFGWTTHLIFFNLESKISERDMANVLINKQENKSATH